MCRLLAPLAFGIVLLTTAVSAQVSLPVAPAPVTSVTSQIGNVQFPTVCGNATIPAGNTVANTSTETAFATTCIIPANSAAPGNVVYLHVGGVYSAGTAQNARGRIHLTQSGTPMSASDPTLIDTGAVGGLAASTNQEWYGDVWITFQTGATAIDVQGALTFQTGSNAIATVPIANTTPFTVDPTKAITLYLTVTWGAASASNSMQLRTMVAK